MDYFIPLIFDALAFLFASLKKILSCFIVTFNVYITEF